MVMIHNQIGGVKFKLILLIVIILLIIGFYQVRHGMIKSQALLNMGFYYTQCKIEVLSKVPLQKSSSDSLISEIATQLNLNNGICIHGVLHDTKSVIYPNGTLPHETIYLVTSQINIPNNHYLWFASYDVKNRRFTSINHTVQDKLIYELNTPLY